jgi:tetratricopeptide (TPR) repeat protein
MRRIGIVAAVLLAFTLGTQAEGPAIRQPIRGAASVALARDAAKALFVQSNLSQARRIATSALASDPKDIEALFVTMEAAALQADTPAELGAAVRLCDLQKRDRRADIAAARILDLAGNTSAFRDVAPRIRKLAKAETAQADSLRIALLAAAQDGLPGPSVSDLAHQAGFLTDWHLAGPFGRFANVDFERSWPPESDALAHRVSGSAAMERFQFQDGNVVLPDYFSSGGVYYASSQATLPAAGDWVVRAEAGGTLVVFIDGKVVLTHDDRFHALPAIASARLKLSAGSHTVLAKFLASASPFRIALVHPHFQAESNAVPVSSRQEQVYIKAARQYWAADYAGALATLSADSHPNAVLAFLQAQAWAHLASGTPEEISSLNATLAAAPDAYSAQAMRAARYYSDGRFDDALPGILRVAAAHPDFAPAQELRYELAAHSHWQTEATDALTTLMRLHPACSVLRDAVQFFRSESEYPRAAEAENALRSCAPGSLAYPEMLSETGRHREAAEAAAAIVQAQPLDRDARALLVRELNLAGEIAAGHQEAVALAALAPNSRQFRDLAANDGPVGDDSAHPRVIDPKDAFYTRFRRDGPQVVRATASRLFSGGPAVALLDTRVVRLRWDGGADLYVHKLTRVLDHGGIERYGEVAIPSGADLIELRTLTPTGAVAAEPEIDSRKATISMPALAPGNVVEQEYVEHFSAGATDSSRSFSYQFGSFKTPILLARFAVISPAGLGMNISAGAGAPRPAVSRFGEDEIRVWEKDDIAQSVEESAMPHSVQLSQVVVSPAKIEDWRAVRRYYRDAMVESTRAGGRIAEFAGGLPGATDDEKAHALYTAVTAKIRSSSQSLEQGLTPAEDTLSARDGSRTAVFLATARELGIPAELVLAREIGSSIPPEASLNAYTHPLVRVQLRTPGGSERHVVVDLERDGLPFGSLPPALDRSRALLVPLEHPLADEPLFLPLPRAADSEESVADGDLSFDAEGNLSAALHIRLGTWRGAQIRSVLRGTPPGGRRRFFEQLATRIFPGAVDVTGHADNENDPERPLKLWVQCRVPHFLSFSGSEADVDQLAPALSLRRMFVRGSERRFALYIDDLLFENTRFRVRLPGNMRVAQLAADFSIRQRFGSYAVRFRQSSPKELEITRSFHIPVQVITPAEYPEFANFAIQIDDAERQRLTIERANLSAEKR